jgi:hypothetical protein
MIMAGAELRDRVREIVFRLPAQLASREIIDVHPVDACEHSPATFREHCIDLRHMSANDVGHRLS